jgi:hypothetical protein
MDVDVNFVVVEKADRFHEFSFERFVFILVKLNLHEKPKVTPD